MGHTRAVAGACQVRVFPARGPAAGARARARRRLRFVAPLARGYNPLRRRRCRAEAGRADETRRRTRRGRRSASPRILPLGHVPQPVAAPQRMDPAAGCSRARGARRRTGLHWANRSFTAWRRRRLAVKHAASLRTENAERQAPAVRCARALCEVVQEGCCVLPASSGVAHRVCGRQKGGAGRSEKGGPYAHDLLVGDVWVVALLFPCAHRDALLDSVPAPRFSLPHTVLSDSAARLQKTGGDRIHSTSAAAAFIRNEGSIIIRERHVVQARASCR